MPIRPRPPRRPVPLCPKALNTAIRALMDEPASPHRSERYALLLEAWRDLTEAGLRQADCRRAA